MAATTPVFPFMGARRQAFPVYLLMTPKSGIGVVVLSNQAGTDGGLGTYLMRAAIPVETSALEKARKSRKRSHSTPKWADLYTGKQDGPAKGMVITIERCGSSLFLKDNATPSERLQLHVER